MVEDHLRLYRCLRDARVEYLIIGGVASIAYGVPRTTNDLDIFLKPEHDNCAKFLHALKKAGLGTAYLTTAEKLSRNDLTVIEDVIRLDVLTRAKGIAFDECWKRRAVKRINEVPVNFISLDDLIRSKSAVRRRIDRDDILLLKKIKRQTR